MTNQVKGFGLTTFAYDTLFPALLMVAGVLMVASIDIYLPTAPYLRDYFYTSEWMMQLSMMLAPIVASVTGLLYGHWSDMHGRRPAMLFSLIIFVIGSFACCFAKDIWSFLFFRLIQAFGAGGLSVISISVLSDMFTGATYARYMATYSMSFPIMLAIAPVVGANLFKLFGWEANFILLGLIGLALFAFFQARLPETHASHKDTMKWRHIGKNMASLFRDKHFSTLSFCHGLPISISAVYALNSAFIFIDGFGFLPTTYSYIQLIPIFFNLIGSATFRHVVTSWGLHQSLQRGLFVVYVFLSLCFVGIVFKAIQIPIVIITTMCIVNISLSFIISSCGTLALDYDQNKRGLAIAILGLFRNGVVATIVLIVGVFFNGTITPVYIAMSILSIVLLYLAWPYTRKL